jgi:catechol 2,3-dioxygenase-like lactoylglutathione lyase family enzyme
MTEKIRIDSLDHLVLTVRDISRTSSFYRQVLGMQEISFGGDRKALIFGSHKINLHEYGKEIEPKAEHPTPGSADLCFITRTPIEEVEKYIRTCGINIVEGPVQRTGAKGTILSIYLRDPDGNLIELSNHIESKEENEKG